MDQQFEESNAYSKRTYKLLCARASHADLGKKSDRFAARMKQIAKSRDGKDLCSLAVLNSIYRMVDYSDFFFADDGNWLCEML
jgi:hypothetical protein